MYGAHIFSLLLIEDNMYSGDIKTAVVSFIVFQLSVLVILVVQRLFNVFPILTKV